MRKGRVCMPYRGLCVTMRRAQLEIIVPLLCPGRKKFLAPPLEKNCDNVKLFSSNHIIISFKYFIFIPHRNVTDRRTDRIAVSISRVSTLTRDNKNYVRQSLVAPLLMMLKHFTCTERSGPYHVSHTEAPGGGFLVLWLK